MIRLFQVRQQRITELLGERERLWQERDMLKREIEALKVERDTAFQMRDRFFVMGMSFAQKVGVSVGILATPQSEYSLAVIEAPSGQLVTAYPESEKGWFSRFPQLSQDYEMSHYTDLERYYETIIHPLKGQDTLPIPVSEERRQATLPTQVIPSVTVEKKRATRRKKGEVV